MDATPEALVAPLEETLDDKNVRLQKMIVMRGQGKTLAEIGKAFGHSRQWAQQQLGNTGLRKLTPRQRQMAELFKKGDSIGEIAKKTGTTYSNVHKMLSKLGLINNKGH